MRSRFRTKNLDRIAKTIHKDFRHLAYPQSLGKPEETKAEWLERWAGLMSLWPAELEVSGIGYSDCLRRD